MKSQESRYMRIAVPKIGTLLLLSAAGVIAVAQTQTPAQSSNPTGASMASDSVKYYSKDDLVASFAKGGTLTSESNYKVKTANPDEPRGDSIEGGQTRRLSPGDAIVIPPGVPHWMKDVEGTLLYFVVK